MSGSRGQVKEILKSIVHPFGVLGIHCSSELCFVLILAVCKRRLLLFPFSSIKQIFLLHFTNKVRIGLLKCAPSRLAKVGGVCGTVFVGFNNSTTPIVSFIMFLARPTVFLYQKRCACKSRSVCAERGNARYNMYSVVKFTLNQRVEMIRIQRKPKLFQLAPLLRVLRGAMGMRNYRVKQR